MSAYDQRPWLAQYRPGTTGERTVPHGTVLEALRESARVAPDATAIWYFDRAVSLSELDRASDALAVALQQRGVEHGDRVAGYLQNVPQYVIVMVAAWKLGAILVPVNPMYRTPELEHVLADSGARGLVCHESLFDPALLNESPEHTALEWVITTSELDYQQRNDPRVLGSVARSQHPGASDLVELVEQFDGQGPAPVAVGPDDVAFLTYTSGTTGTPKGAMNTHGNVMCSACTFRDWIGLGSSDVIFGVAPLFHITGLVAHMALALLIRAPLVLAYRFEAGVVLDAIRERGATFTIGSITVFIALMNDPSSTAEGFATLTKIYSGGAPIAPSVAARFQERMGQRIHNVYGLTETTSPSHAVPYGAQAPVDPRTGALSVGVPVFSTISRIVDDERNELAPGELGEVVIEGPQVVPGYWRKPAETEHAMPGGRLHTGDVGFMDEQGWFYVVDRKKDMINASGFKVWPREVEDVLQGHPAVLEAAVVGVPDEYRGETVKAFVSLRAGATVEPDELIRFCKEQMAAYKYPRSIDIVDELPKTASGKILRRELRDAEKEAG